MAFAYANMDKMSAEGRTDLRSMWVYVESATLATIKASAYFNEVIDKLAVDDLIYIVASDGNQMVYVTSVTTNVTVAALEAGSIAAGTITNAMISDSAAIAFSKLAALADGNILVGSAANVATSVAMSGDVAIDNTGATTIQANAIDLTMLSAGITPSHVVKFAGEHTTVGGGAAEAITVSGVLATDLVFCQLHTEGAVARTILTAAASVDTVTVTFSGDPSNDHVVAYQVLRAAA